jgi:hypothetical protein
MIRRSLLQLPLLLAAGPRATGTPPGSPSSYLEARAAVERERRALAARWRRGERSAAFQQGCQRAAARALLALARHWVGTTWGLGQPQIERPGGRVNCGTFVGRLLADAGFKVAVHSLQRQPSAFIARTFAAPGRLRRFSGVPLARDI